MATEIELKLSLAPDAIPTLLALSCFAGQVIQEQRLSNTYYDTPELLLSQRKMALRLRQKGNETWLTVKTAGKSEAGLATRHEWECLATPGIFDFAHIEQAELRTMLTALIPQLTTIFRTDFLRRRVVLHYGQSQIEVAIDQGTVSSQGREQALCELELELLSGDIGDLKALATQLQTHLPGVLHPSDISKAQRGYALFAQGK